MRNYLTNGYESVKILRNSLSSGGVPVAYAVVGGCNTDCVACELSFCVRPRAPAIAEPAVAALPVISYFSFMSRAAVYVFFAALLTLPVMSYFASNLGAANYI